LCCVVHIRGTQLPNEPRMPRPEHLQLRGKIYWLRVRVPDELRPVLDRLEVRRSLGTSDPVEAKRRVRIERLKTEAEFDDARRRLAAVQATQSSTPRSVELSDEQVWMLATRWFVKQEKHNAERVSDSWDGEDLETRIDQLGFVEKWDEVSGAMTECG
jgi:hypothetical protein